MSVFTWKDVIKILGIALFPTWIALWMIIEYDRKEKEPDHRLGF